MRKMLARLLAVNAGMATNSEKSNQARVEALSFLSSEWAGEIAGHLDLNAGLDRWLVTEPGLDGVAVQGALI